MVFSIPFLVVNSVGNPKLPRFLRSSFVLNLNSYLTQVVNATSYFSSKH